MAFFTTSFMTDMYELTMVGAAITFDAVGRKCVFEAFGRRLPGRRCYGVVCDTGRVLKAIHDFRFSPEEIEHLASYAIAPSRTIQYLADYRFAGSVYGYAEGERYFPRFPVLTVTGSFAECAVLETVVLSILDHDPTAATAISCMTTVAHGRSCLGFGARRTHETAAVHTVRAAIIAGFMAMPDLEGGCTYDLGVVGTSAHSSTLVHDSKREAFAAQAVTMSMGTTLLVDTYGIAEGVNNVIAAVREAGGELGAVRLDSGDPVAQAFTVCRQLDGLDAASTKIIVTGDFDEYSVATPGAASIDSYGVGTRVVIGSGHPTAEMVYKLIQREGVDGKMHGVVESSKDETSMGGLKVAGRICDQRGSAAQEPIVSTGSWQEGLDYLGRTGARLLQIKFVDAGAIDESRVGKAAITTVTAHHEKSRTEFPYDGWRLSGSEPAVPTKMLDIFEGDNWRLHLVE